MEERERRTAYPVAPRSETAPWLRSGQADRIALGRRPELSCHHDLSVVGATGGAWTGDWKVGGKAGTETPALLQPHDERTQDTCYSANRLERIRACHSTGIGV